MPAILGLGSSLVTAIRVIPLYERAHPILACSPEIKHDHVHLGILDGNIEVNNISFSYDKNSPNEDRDFIENKQRHTPWFPPCSLHFQMKTKSNN